MGHVILVQAWLLQGLFWDKVHTQQRAIVRAHDT